MIAKLRLLRHGTSAMNVRSQSANHPIYNEFIKAFSEDPTDPLTQNLALQLRESLPPYTDMSIPLDEQGQQQFFDVGKVLSAGHSLPQAVYISPSDRCRQSLDALRTTWPALVDVPSAEDPRLLEQNRGAQEASKGWRIFDTLYPEQRELRSLQGDYWYRPPGGENVEDVRIRVGLWLTEINRRHPNEDVLAITHFGPIIGLRANIEDLTPRQTLAMQQAETLINGGMTTIIATQGRLAIQAYNRGITCQERLS